MFDRIINNIYYDCPLLEDDIQECDCCYDSSSCSDDDDDNEIQYEIWALDREPSYTDNEGKEGGGFIHIFRRDGIEQIPIEELLLEYIKENTGQYSKTEGRIPFGASHIRINKNSTHAIITFTESGFILVIDVDTKCVVYYLYAGERIGIALPSPDNKYILFSCLDTKTIKRIDCNYQKDEYSLSNKIINMGHSPSILHIDEEEKKKIFVYTNDGSIHIGDINHMNILKTFYNLVGPGIGRGVSQDGKALYFTITNDEESNIFVMSTEGLSPPFNPFKGVLKTKGCDFKEIAIIDDCIWVVDTRKKRIMSITRHGTIEVIINICKQYDMTSMTITPSNIKGEHCFYVSTSKESKKQGLIIMAIYDDGYNGEYLSFYKCRGKKHVPDIRSLGVVVSRK